MTLPESIGIGLGLLAIVAPVQWPKMHKAVTYPIATLGFLVLGWSVILAIEEATGMKIQTGPLTMLIGAAALAAGAVFWQAQVAKGQAERPYAEHGNRPVDDKPVPSKNSPNVSAGGNITIGHIGDVINPPPTATPKRPLDEKLPGFASGIMVQTDDVTEVRKKFQYSFRAPDGAKIGFYLSASNRYAFSVTDINGEEYKLDVPLGANGLPFGKWAYIFCEVGTASSYSYLRALLNGKEVARRDFDFPLELGSRQWTPVLGADAGGQNGGAFMMMEMGAYSTTLSDKDLMALAENALSAYGLKP